MAEMATLKKQNKRLQDKMTQLRQLCEKQQAASKTTLEVGTVTGVFSHYSHEDVFGFVCLTYSEAAFTTPFQTVESKQL